MCWQCISNLSEEQMNKELKIQLVYFQFFIVILDYLVK